MTRAATPPDGEPLLLRPLLLDQEGVLGRLSRARARGRLAHSYLFLGPRGCGKTRVALAFAQELLCTAPQPPCGLCPGCRKTARLTHPDLHLVLPMTREEALDPEAIGQALETYANDRYQLTGTAPNASIGIDRIRALKAEAAKALVEASWRVIILSGADRMTEQAAQSALKLVEEPPAGTLLILEAEETTDLLPTLVSRCQRIRVRPLSRARLAAVLAGELGVPELEARLLSALAAGSLGRALELRGEKVLELRDRCLQAFDLPPGAPPDPADVERRARRLERAWTTGTARRAAELLLLWYRDLLAVRHGLGGASAESTGGAANADLVDEARRWGELLSAEEIARRARIVEEMAAAAEQNVNPALALHAALARIAGGPREEDRFVRL